MKKNSILIATFAVIAAASVVNAEEPVVDFDGTTGQNTKIVKTESEFNKMIPEPEPASYIYKREKYGYDDDSGTTNVYATNSKCVGGDCQEHWVNYACNLKTCGKKSLSNSEKSARVEENKMPLSEMIGHLDEASQLQFYRSLTFTEGKLTGAYIADIETGFGKQAVKAVLKELGVGKTESKGTDITETDYIRDHKCVAPATCHKAAGYICTENC